jgi:hypothetical protein
MKSLINIGEAEWRGHTGLEALWIIRSSKYVRNNGEFITHHTPVNIWLYYLKQLNFIDLSINYHKIGISSLWNEIIELSTYHTFVQN